MGLEKALVVDADKETRMSLQQILSKKGLEVITCEDALFAKELLKNQSFDLLLYDVCLAKVQSLELLSIAKSTNPDTIVILTTSLNSIDNAIEGMKEGAFNFLIKPLSEQVLLTLLAKAEEHFKLIEKNSFLYEEITQRGQFQKHHMIAESPIMLEILKDIAKVAKSSASVFISGESGTGKEVIARALHQQSPRAPLPFISVNCAAIPQNLLESELFGHEKGSFTGALSRRIGRFEMADKGTLLLDEISEIPLELQAKLLRAVQEQEFERVGGNKTLSVDIRFIATSNRNLKNCVAEKTFREDLYYRLNVIPIHLPPLRDRREDIIPLSEYFLDKLCIENRKRRPRLTEAAKKVLLDYPWPGNVRELANIIERAVVMSASDQIVVEDLSLDLSAKSCPVPSAQIKESPLEPLLNISQMEKKLIAQALEVANGNKTQAAKLLGISVRTLRNKLNLPQEEMVN